MKSHKNIALSPLEKIYDLLVQVFIVLLPWSTLISVFLVYKVHIPGANFIKECIFLLITLSGCVLLWKKYKNTKICPLKISTLDILVISYIVIMSLITIFTTGLRGLVFGGRYDFMFLVTFLVFYHTSQFLRYSAFHYVKIFLISAGAMIFVSGLLKFPLSEDLLLYVGFSQNISAWDFGGAPPIFHGIDGANVRRFQGVLDWPNTMGAFLIIFIGILAYFFRNKKDWYFPIGVIIVGLIAMIFYTYSRSAVLALGAGFGIAIFGGVTYLLRHYRKQVIALLLIAVAGGYVLSVKYSGSTQSLIGREGSTKWHAERMIVGVNRFFQKPFGEGMGSAWPAYRYVLKLEDEWRKNVEEIDQYYIPESWYIQQFIEWWILGGVLFLLITLVLFVKSFSVHSILAGAFSGIAVMNLVLHTYESSIISFTLFTLFAIIISYHDRKKYAKK